MKITETIERDCCQHSDRRVFRGRITDPSLKDQKLWFCVHCGQLWWWTRKPGEMDGGPERLTITGTSDE
jgi:hypothetical protein